MGGRPETGILVSWKGLIEIVFAILEGKKGSFSEGLYLCSELPALAMNVHTSPLHSLKLKLNTCSIRFNHLPSNSVAVMMSDAFLSKQGI